MAEQTLALIQKAEKHIAEALKYPNNPDFIDPLFEILGSNRGSALSYEQSPHPIKQLGENAFELTLLTNKGFQLRKEITLEQLQLLARVAEPALNSDLSVASVSEYPAANNATPLVELEPAESHERLPLEIWSPIINYAASGDQNTMRFFSIVRRTSRLFRDIADSDNLTPVFQDQHYIMNLSDDKLIELAKRSFNALHLPDREECKAYLDKIHPELWEIFKPHSRFSFTLALERSEPLEVHLKASGGTDSADPARSLVVVLRRNNLRFIVAHMPIEALIKNSIKLLNSRSGKMDCFFAQFVVSTVFGNDTQSQDAQRLQKEILNSGVSFRIVKINAQTVRLITEPIFAAMLATFLEPPGYKPPMEFAIDINMMQLRQIALCDVSTLSRTQDYIIF